MFVDLLYGWLGVRLALSIVFGVRAANRLRHDETSRRAFAWMGRFHLAGAAVTWVLEALVRVDARPLAGPLAQVLVFPLMLLYTCWVPVVDALGFMAVSALVAVLLVRRRLARYRDELILGEPEQRVQAARACEFLGRLAAPAMPELLEVAADPDPELRFRAVRAVGAIRPADPEATDRVRRALTDTDPKVRAAAGCTLAMLGAGDHPAVVPGVIAALKADEDDMREAGVRAAWKLEAAAAPAIDPLVSLAEHWKLGRMAIEALAVIGEPAAPALTRLRSHPDPKVQEAALGALNRIEMAAAEESAARGDA
jgi:hypothetical protein